MGGKQGQILLESFLMAVMVPLVLRRCLCPHLSGQAPSSIELPDLSSLRPQCSLRRSSSLSWTSPLLLPTPHLLSLLLLSPSLWWPHLLLRLRHIPHHLYQLLQTSPHRLTTPVHLHCLLSCLLLLLRHPISLLPSIHKCPIMALPQPQNPPLLFLSHLGRRR